MTDQPQPAEQPAEHSCSICHGQPVRAQSDWGVGPVIPCPGLDTQDHPLVQYAKAAPRQDSTSVDPDLVDALGKLKQELNGFTHSLILGTLTPSQWERMVQLFEDIAGLIRMHMQTRQIVGALNSDPWPEAKRQ